MVDLSVNSHRLEHANTHTNTHKNKVVSQNGKWQLKVLFATQVQEFDNIKTHTHFRLTTTIIKREEVNYDLRIILQ